MLDRAWGGSLFRKLAKPPTDRPKSPRVSRRPCVEGLEDRLVLNASLAALPDITAPSSQGYQVSLDGSGDTNSQTYSVQSSNPDVKAAVASGPFWTITVSHTAAAGNPNDVSFTGNITYQLFQDLTPTTVSKFDTFINDGYYIGKQITRIVSNFSGTGAGDYVIQGGAPTSGNSSGQPGTPYPVELVQQLAFTGPGTLAVANTGQVNSNDTQFFFNTGAETALNYGYTIFGQVVAGQSTIADLTKVAVEAQTGGTEVSKPISPVTITASSLSTTDPNGVVHIDTTGAVPGETSKVTVTATDSSTHATTSQSFNVTVGATVTAPPAGSPNANSNITFKPLAFPVTKVVPTGTTTGTPIQLNASSQNPSNKSVSLAYSLVSQPAHGTISGFNATTGALTYTPNSTYTGSDSFTYTSTNTGGSPSPLGGNTATVTIAGTTTPPLAQAVMQTITGGVPNQIQLNGSSENPGNSSIVLSYGLVTQPAHGTITNFSATTGTLTYTPNTGYTGPDSFTYNVINTGGVPSPQTGNTATVSLTVTAAAAPPVSTGTVRQIGTVLVVTPLPRTDKGTNQIVVNETNNVASPASNILVVSVNNQYDVLQPLASGINRIVVFGAKASDKVTILPAVDPTIAVTLDGGHGGTNVLQAGAGPTRLHGWFGHNTLIGGTGPNQLVGRAGHVRFRPTSTTNEIFAGIPNPGYSVHRHLFHNAYHLNPPGGTFFKYVNGRVVPIPTPSAHTQTRAAAKGTTSTISATSVHTRAKTPKA